VSGVALAKSEGQMTRDRIGKPENQGNSVQVTRITGNQDALEMVRGFAPYPFSDANPTCSTSVENPLQIHPFYAKQSQFASSAK
jgi:hypothetical protein